ncbi:NADPH--cytochrome P450 reductase [Zalerion maritima]|uniref:NADPH--cytochrome P450 reductase n=1 Tax=Zalerion maritima TaxID=339359 RepID=A0AAD5WWX3_9PEZI|nr:NADPH--cytochrome P450 reductase [Zalerion maritima]
MTTPIPEPPALPLLGHVHQLDPSFLVGCIGRLADQLAKQAVPSQEPAWGVAHSILMPAFGPMSIKNMFPQMHDLATQLTPKWARFGPSVPIDVPSDFTRLALDTIALCAMDFRFNSYCAEELHPFINAVGDFLTESGGRALRLGILTMLMRGRAQKYQQDIDLMRETSREVLEYRKQTLTIKPKGFCMRAILRDGLDATALEHRLAGTTPASGKADGAGAHNWARRAHRPDRPRGRRVRRHVRGLFRVPGGRRVVPAFSVAERFGVETAGAGEPGEATVVEARTLAAPRRTGEEAPWRGFVQQRAASHDGGRQEAGKGGAFFHGRRAEGKDDLYAEELKVWEEKGVVTVRRAYSRDDAGTGKYVQDLLWEAREEVEKLWDGGAKVFVCGSRKVGERVRDVAVRIAMEDREGNEDCTNVRLRRKRLKSGMRD